jgi:hypothetical protein
MTEERIYEIGRSPIVDTLMEQMRTQQEENMKRLMAVFVENFKLIRDVPPYTTPEGIYTMGNIDELVWWTQPPETNRNSIKYLRRD